MVSIVVNNHNYCEFVAEAIDSALAQTHPDVEVIVVDDGSSDASRAMIDRYRERVMIVFKDNGGQASAFNAGFERATGDYVIFLDSDDALDPRTAERTAAAFARRPELAKVHSRLEVVDREGRPTGAFTPPTSVPLPNGDLRERLRRHPDDVPHPPSSGNAYAAWALARVLPIPEPEFRLLADVYLLNTVPLLGPVASLDGVGGRYRAHGANRHYAQALDLESVRATIRTTHAVHGHMKELAEALGLEGFPAPDDNERSLVFLSQRLISKKLEPRRHPLPRDTVPALARRGVVAAARHSNLRWPLRVVHAGWFVAFALAPTWIAVRLAEQLLYVERRSRLASILDQWRRPR